MPDARSDFLFHKTKPPSVVSGYPAVLLRWLLWNHDVLPLKLRFYFLLPEAACCHEFIVKLENGYDTNAGDAGGKLSGGERQRITIARAILKNARVIILDEATAYADPENEYLIQNAISKLVKGKTLIVVAHRLATIQKADQILVVENGKIVGCGRQEELLSECPLYQRLWSDYVSSADQVEGGTF